MDELRDYKRECLLDEHQTLSSFVEKEIVSTAAVRSCCVAAWLIGLGLLLAADAAPIVPPLALLVAVAGFWLIDFFYSYVGVIYKMRRLRVREWLHLLPDAAEEEIRQWVTPANPFDGLGRSGKLTALRDTLVSPVIFSVYATLALATVVIFSLA